MFDFNKIVEISLLESQLLCLGDYPEDFIL